MNLPQILIVFSVSWWLVFLPALSIGIQNQYEADTEYAEGSEEGAPVRPMLAKKAIWATIGAAILTAIAAIIIPMLAP